PLGGGRFLTAPSVIGQLLTEMAPIAGQRALVVGARPGYSAAVLAAIGLEVVAVENSPELAERARAAGVEVVQGPLQDGFAKGAPYEQIPIDGAVDAILEPLIEQL